MKDRPLVGVFVDTTHKFGSSIVRGILRYANIQRSWLLAKDLRAIPDRGVEWGRFDGVIITTAAWALKEALDQCPNVIYCSGAGDPKLCPVVGLDGMAVGRQAAEHLMECRLEHFAFFSFIPRLGEGRLAGFSQALAERGFTCPAASVLMQTVRDPGREQRLRLIEWLQGLPKPVGVLAVDDLSAHDVADACLEVGLAVPEEVAIIGVNNDDLLCEGAWPPLSSVEGEFSRVGFKAAQVLERMLAGERLTEENRLFLLPPLGVVQRQSTNILAVKDSNLAKALQFIREHACDPCTVNDVLKVVPVGRRWLERHFVEQFGRTPHDEIARVKIETAKRFMRESALKLNDISDRCGFSELKRFYITFRKVTGTTPAAYRRQYLFGDSLKA